MLHGSLNSECFRQAGTWSYSYWTNKTSVAQSVRQCHTEHLQIQFLWHCWLFRQTKQIYSSFHTRGRKGNCVHAYHYKNYIKAINNNNRYAVHGIVFHLLVKCHLSSEPSIKCKCTKHTPSIKCRWTKHKKHKWTKHTKCKRKKQKVQMALTKRASQANDVCTPNITFTKVCIISTRS